MNVDGLFAAQMPNDQAPASRIRKEAAPDIRRFF
jgi:hypothetical protein